MYQEIPILSFISAAATLVPLIWYLQARNIAAVAIGLWLSATNLAYAVDAVVWAKNANVKASVWCDISTSFIIGSRIALPAACFSICFHLERLASFCQNSTRQAKHRRIVFECLMSFGLPTVCIALHLAVQPRRFDIFYGFGCRPATYPTIATIFLVMLPPLLLTVATIVCAGIAWSHFLVHGIRFYRKKGSISPTRNLYIRLVGMALLEAMLSAVLTTVVMWGVLSTGLAPIQNMSRDIRKVVIWDSEAITNTIQIVLRIEWSVTVVQSILFFGLFACRMEAVRRGGELIRSFWGLLQRRKLSVTLGEGTSEHSLTSITVPRSTLPFTEVDLSLVIESASTFASYDPSNKSSTPASNPSRCPSLVEYTPEDVVISAIAPAMHPLESPSHASTISSSHNSLESSLDASWLVLPAKAWPRPPPSIPFRFPRRPFSVGYDTKQLEEGGLDVSVAYPRAKLRSYAIDSFGLALCQELEKHQAICVTVIKETQ